MKKNPIIRMAEDIERLTNGLCTVGVGPYGFGVSNDNASSVGIMIGEEPRFIPEDNEPLCSTGVLFVQAYLKTEGGAISEEAVRHIANHPENEATSKICAAVLELAGTKVPVSREEYNEAFGMLADRSISGNTAEKKGKHPQVIKNLAGLKQLIKPGVEFMATSHKKHPEIVGLVRVVTEVQTNAFYSVIKDQPKHKYSDCNYGKGFRTDFEKASYYRFNGTTVQMLDARARDGSVLCEFEVYAPEQRMDQSQNSKYTLRPATEKEAGLFYALPPEQDEALGCIGHVRIDFGKSGKEFWHTWHPRGPEELNSADFKKELTSVVDELRKTVLKSRTDMSNFCYNNGGQISGGWVQNHGFVIETDSYQYYLRCNPAQGDYNGYLTCFDKQVQEMNQANNQDQGLAMGGMQL